MPHGKFNRSRASKALNKSEGATTSTGGVGHARERHAAPTTGASVDAYLLGRVHTTHGATKMSAFVNARDQDRAVAAALATLQSTVSDSSATVGRKTIVARTSGAIPDITVRVAEVPAEAGAAARAASLAGGASNTVADTASRATAECRNAKLREVTVVYEVDQKGTYTIVTAFPSDSYGGT